MWNVFNKILKFDASWKHTVRFYHEMNEKKPTNIYQLISFLALRIYEYKMWCRIEKKMNHQKVYYVKYTLNIFYSALKRLKYKLWKIYVLKNVADKLKIHVY